MASKKGKLVSKGGGWTELGKTSVAHQMHTISDELQTALPFILPYLLTSSMYFILRLPGDEPCLTAAFIKCLPILYLIWFVWLRGISNHPYNWRILLGLVASCVGDFALIWGQDNVQGFIAGTCSFGVAHVFYISAHGIILFGWKEFACFALIFASGVIIVLPHIPGIRYYTTPIYFLLCNSMAWRAAIRYTASTDEGASRWRKAFAAIGGVFFVISDFSLGYNMFVQRLVFQRELIMITYYLAQLLISLSVENLCVSVLSSELDSLHVQ